MRRYQWSALGHKRTSGTCVRNVRFTPESGLSNQHRGTTAFGQKQTSSQELGSLMGLGTEALGDALVNRLAIARVYRQRVGDIAQTIGLTFCQLAVSHADQERTSQNVLL